MSAAVLEPTLDEDLEVPPHLQSARAVLRRGLHESPELRKGLGLTVVISLGVTASTLITPVLVQQIFDHGFDGGFRPGYVYTLCAAALGLVVMTYLASRLAARRLVKASEQALMALRVRTFEHIHQLSIAEQTEEKRGVFVARVTADVDTLSQFTEWGGIAWIISIALAFGGLALMLVYSWQLTLAVVLLVIPLLWVVSSLQGQLTQAFDLVRTRVGQLMSEVSESIMGAAVVRAYGLEDQTDRRVKRAIDERYRATIVAHWRVGGVVPDRDVLLRHRGVGHRRARCVLRAGLGPHVRSGVGVHLPVGRLPARVHGPARDLRRHADRDRRLAEDPDGPRPPDRDRRSPSPASTSRWDRSRSGRPSWTTPTVRAGRCCTASRSRSNAGRTWRSSARRAAGRPRSRSCWPGSPTRRRGTSRWTGWICATCRRHRVGAPSAWSRRTGSCSTRPSARTCGTAGRRRATVTSRPRSRSWDSRMGGSAAAGPGHAGRRAR